MTQNQHKKVLQLNNADSGEQIERAYHASIARYQRLTKRGPLKFYRKELINDVEKAYETLKKQGQTQNHRQNTHSVTEKYAKIRNLSYRTTTAGLRAISHGGLVNLTARRLPNKSRNVSQNAENYDCKTHRTTEATQTEDAFCKEVIYRLEGDLIRYDSRKELLKIAADRDIGLFKANMLIAQIVEAVRQNNLYEPSSREREAKKHDIKTRAGTLGILIAVVAALTLAADAVIILLSTQDR